MMPGHNDFTTIYCVLLSRLLTIGHLERNERTGVEVKALNGGESFKLDLSSRWLRLGGSRRFFPGTAAAEIAWFLSGSKDVTWLRKYAPIWDKFVEADGVTIESAYGYRWRQHFGRDQITAAIDALRANPSDRRVLVSAWDPARDGLGQPSKNVPCPTHFTLSIVGGRLHSSLFLRSSDVFVGLPYDVMGHAMLMSALATTLAVSLGTMHVTLAHPHLYSLHFPMAQVTWDRYLEHGTSTPSDYFQLPSTSVKRITLEPENYVHYVRSLSARVEWPEWSPRPEVVA